VFISSLFRLIYRNTLIPLKNSKVKKEYKMNRKMYECSIKALNVLLFMLLQDHSYNIGWFYT